MALREEILVELPDTEISSQVGRSSSFEVSINGQTVFSKLKTHGFPDAKDVIQEIRRVRDGDKAQEITEAQSPGCTLL